MVSGTATGNGEKKFAMRTVVAASAIGTTIEWYDFLIYSTAASLVLNKLFFPTNDPLIGKLLAIGTIGVGFFVRPLGAIVLSHFGDRVGRKYVIWVSILGVLPFTLLLPYADLFWTSVLSVVIGLILASAFSAILVYAQELVPGRVGMISGLFFGLAFGVAGIGAALLGNLADVTGIGFVYRVCSFLPIIGLLTGFLPNLERARANRVNEPVTQ